MTLTTPATSSSSSGASNAKTQREIQPVGCASEAFVEATRAGDLDAAKALHALDPTKATCSREIVQLAAMSGCVALLDWTHARTTDDCSKAFLHRLFERVCRKPGHLEVFEWLNEHAYRFATPAVFRATAETGNMDTLQWLIQHYPESFELCKSIHMDNVASYDNLDMIKWLHTHDFFFSKTAIDNAAQHGLLHIVEWLHTNRVDGCSTWAMDSAATFGHMDVVLFLHFHRTEGCTPIAMDMAAENGHLEVLQFLHFNRTEGCTTAAMDNAASVEILAFLDENRTEGCTDEIVSKAVSKSSVAILEWLLVNKPEIVNLDDIRVLAEQTNKPDVLAWIEVIAAAADDNEAQTESHDGGIDDDDNNEAVSESDNTSSTLPSCNDCECDQGLLVNK